MTNTSEKKIWKDKISTDLKEIAKEERLSKFLKEIDENVFVKSTDSVSGDEEELIPTIEDLEGIIVISGEWDREDLKNILYSL
jgi:hypothetical protein